jgi:hypothetical protein
VEIAYNSSTAFFLFSKIAICLEHLDDPEPVLRQWLAIAVGRVWDHYEPARYICSRREFVVFFSSKKWVARAGVFFSFFFFGPPRA